MTTQPSLFDVPASVPPPAPYVAGSATSQAAAESQPEEWKATQRGLLLRLLRSAGPSGLSDPEMQEASGLAGDTQRPRIRELEQMGVVVRTLLTRPTAKGRAALLVVAAECWAEPMGRHETDHRRGRKL